MSFDEDFPHKEIFDIFGKDATFTSSGGSVGTIVVVDHDAELEPLALQSQVVENQTLINLLVAEVGEPVRGDTITITAGATLYTVDRVVSNDQFVVRVAVT